MVRILEGQYDEVGEGVQQPSSFGPVIFLLTLFSDLSEIDYTLTTYTLPAKGACGSPSLSTPFMNEVDW